MQELHFASGLKQTNISFIYHGYVSFLESLIKFTFSLCNGIEVFKDGPSINPFLDPPPFVIYSNNRGGGRFHWNGKEN